MQYIQNKHKNLIFTITYESQNYNLMSLLINHKTNELTGSVLENCGEEEEQLMFRGIKKKMARKAVPFTGLLCSGCWFKSSTHDPGS